MLKFIWRSIRCVLWATVFHPKLLMIPIFLFDRLVTPQWYKAWGAYCKSQVNQMDPTSRFLGRVYLNYPDGLTIGRHVRVGRGCFLFCLGGVTIGDGTVLSRNVTIYSANHNIDSNRIPYDNSYVCGAVTIGRGVWIGMNALITPGVKIGDGAIIGMGTVVSKDVPDGTTVVGAPQRNVGQRASASLKRMIDEKAYFASEWPDA